MSATIQYIRRQREYDARAMKLINSYCEQGVHRDYLFRWIAKQMGRGYTNQYSMSKFEKLISLLENNKDEIFSLDKFKGKYRDPLKVQAYNEFDWLANYNNMTREQAYKWISSQLGISDCDFSMSKLSRRRMEEMIEIIQSRRQRLIDKIKTFRPIS